MMRGRVLLIYINGLVATNPYSRLQIVGTSQLTFVIVVLCLIPFRFTALLLKVNSSYFRVAPILL